ncbi:hypothetical protein [Mesorhizobium sp. A623]
MIATSDEPASLPQSIDWNVIFSEVNSWRGACMHHFSMVEAAVTETLLSVVRSFGSDWIAD